MGLIINASNGNLKPSHIAYGIDIKNYIIKSNKTNYIQYSKGQSETVWLTAVKDKILQIPFKKSVNSMQTYRIYDVGFTEISLRLLFMPWNSHSIIHDLRKLARPIFLNCSLHDTVPQIRWNVLITQQNALLAHEFYFEFIILVSSLFGIYHFHCW